VGNFELLEVRGSYLPGRTAAMAHSFVQKETLAQTRPLKGSMTLSVCHSIRLQARRA
jgi:hypothetical protein